MKQNLPKINETYNCFDDGKIRENRRYECLVLDIIPFDEIDESTLDIWKESVKECYWLFNKVTDYFIICKSDRNDREVFARTTEDEWYTIDELIYHGLLDVDGSLTKSLEIKLKTKGENYEK